MENTLVQLFGWKATLLHGDPTVWDRYQWIARHLKRGQFRTLDAGCGTGAFTFAAAVHGNTALGLSFDDRNMRIARQRAEILGLRHASFAVRDLRQLEGADQSLGCFDQILCIETIEHIIDDRKLLNNLAALLSPNGRLLLTTPFEGHIPVPGEPTDPTWRNPVEDGGHVRFGYSEAELRNLFHSSGLEISHVEFISGWVSQKLYTWWCNWNQVLPHRLVWALLLPLRPLQLLDPWLTRWLSYPYFSIGVVAHKRAR